MSIASSIAGGGSGIDYSTSKSNAAKTADYPIVAGDTGKTFTNAGAVGAVIFTLPVAVIGYWYRFVVVAAQNLEVLASGTNVIYLGTDVTAAGGHVDSALPGSVLDVECVAAGKWMGVGSGEWSAT